VAEDTDRVEEREKAFLAQPGLAVHLVWDQAVLETAPPLLGPNWTPARIREEALRRRFMVCASTLEQLADLSSLPVGALVRSVAQYNASRSGADPLGRAHRPLPLIRSPFYAMRVVGGMLLSRGGPRVDAHLRPLGARGRPILGLYAAGELLGMGQLCGDGSASGMSLGPALSLGRLLAKRIAGGDVASSRRRSPGSPFGG
jgi:fumarate reductase flavoprotein subunit